MAESSYQRVTSDITGLAILYGPYPIATFVILPNDIPLDPLDAYRRHEGPALESFWFGFNEVLKVKTFTKAASVLCNASGIYIRVIYLDHYGDDGEARWSRLRIVGEKDVDPVKIIEGLMNIYDRLNI